MATGTGEAKNGRYLLLEMLGEDGSAWRGRDPRTGRDVLLRRLMPPQDFDTGVLQRMKRDAQAAHGLLRPDLIAVHDHFHDEDGLPWAVTEFARGRSLAEIVRDRGPLPPAEAARIGARVAAVLAAAHEAGILHRGLRPSMVFLADGRVTVTGFGLASGRDATVTSDLRALGATLYTAVEGRPPSAGRSRPSSRAGTLGPVLRDLMGDDPSLQPTAEQAAAALGALASPSGSARARPGLTRRRLLLAAGVAVGVIAGGAAARFLSSGGEEARSPRRDHAPASDGPPLTGQTEEIWTMAFAPGGRILATGDGDIVRLWDVGGRVQLGGPLISHTGTVWSIAFSPDGETLAVAGDGEAVILWDVETRIRIGDPLSGHPGGVGQVVFSPDGRTLATCGDDGTVRLWDTATRTRIGSPGSSRSFLVSAVAFSPDGGLLATGGTDRTLRLWDVGTLALKGPPLTDGTAEIHALAFSPDGGTIATCSGDGSDQRDTASLWDVSGGSPAVHPLTGGADSVRSVAFSPDGRILAVGEGTASDGRILLWDTASRTRIGRPLTGHGGPVTQVAFSPDGALLASAGLDRTIRLWRL